MFLLGCMPCLQEYGNISYHSSDTNANDDEADRTSSSVNVSGSHLASNVILFEKHHDKRSRSLQNKKLDLLKPVVPIVSIEMPD